MRYFPLFADLDAAGVLVAGGGEQAAQKVRLLRKTSARITVVAETVTDELRDLAQQNAIAIVPRAFLAGDLDGQRLAYAATGDRALDAAVSQAAQARGIPVNVVDVPELSTFITPAIVDRAPVTVAIGTEGAAPVLAREIKTRLESWLPANLGALASRAQSLRSVVADSIPDGRARRRLWERLLQGPFRRAVLSGAEADATRIFEGELAGSPGTWPRPRRPDRLRPRRPRSPHAQGPAAHAGGRRAGGRPAGEPQDPRLRPARCRAHLRRQDARPQIDLASRDQPHPRARGLPPARWWPGSKAAIR